MPKMVRLYRFYCDPREEVLTCTLLHRYSLTLSTRWVTQSRAPGTDSRPRLVRSLPASPVHLLTPFHLVFLNLGDLGWAKAAYSTFGCFLAGATLFVLPPPPGAFAPAQLIDALHRFPITTLCAPPTAYRSLCTTEAKERIKRHAPRSLVHCVSAGELSPGASDLLCKS